MRGRDGAEFRFAGSLQLQNNVALDGISTRNGFTGTLIGSLTGFVESYQEVRIDSANNTAEFGAIGQVSVVSKSGTNEPHGSVFDYYSSPGLNSRNPFDLTRGGGVTHSPGFSLGGPVKLPKIYNGQNRTFFFGSFEAQRGGGVTSTGIATVPLAAWRAGDFSALLPGTVIRDPLTGQPFPGNRIPEARLNPVARKIQDRFFPLPNFGNTNVLESQNFRIARTRPFNDNNYVNARLDHHFSPQSFFFVRGTYSRWQKDDFDSPLPAIGLRWQRQDARGLNVSYTYTFSPALINEARWGLAFSNEGRTAR